MQCKLCGKDLTYIIKILGDKEGVLNFHRQVHINELLDEIKEFLYGTNGIYPIIKSHPKYNKLLDKVTILDDLYRGEE